MGHPTGSANLPLHGGRVPAWLHQRMSRLGRIIVEAIVLEHGRDELLSRLAHPFWFQSFGAVMGMDWHSSGITTSVVGALKRGLGEVSDELGLYVCGGRGRHSRRTPDELRAAGERTGLDGERLARTSKLVAKVDSAAVQDGYELYLHAFVLAGDGKWVVVQQGMNGAERQARRYHWSSDAVRSFVEQPHSAIDGAPGAAFVNLTDARAGAAREAQVALVATGPDAVTQKLAKLLGARGAAQASLPHLDMPAHHDVRAEDVRLRRVHAALRAAAEAGPRDFAALLQTPGVGARTVWSLAMVAEVIYGAPSRFDDPARHSLAHGGKDGHPFPVPLDVYDRTMRTLRRAVTAAKLGRDETLDAIRRLDAETRRLETVVETGISFDALIARERAASPRYRGRTVFDDPPARATRARRRSRRVRHGQLALPGVG